MLTVVVASPLSGWVIVVRVHHPSGGSLVRVLESVKPLLLFVLIHRRLIRLLNALIHVGLPWSKRVLIALSRLINFAFGELASIVTLHLDAVLALSSEFVHFS